MYGKKMYKRGGKTGETSDKMERESDKAKKEEVRKIKRKLDSYTPQTQRKLNQTPPKGVAANRMGGAKDNFADVVARAKKAKKPR